MSNSVKRLGLKDFLIFKLAVCLSLAPISSVSAQVVEESGARSPGNPAILAVNRSLSLSYLQSRLYYVEPSDSLAFITNTNYADYEWGNLNGGRAAFSYMGPWNSYVHMEWSGAEGVIRYTGYFQPSFAPANVNSRATTQEYNFKIGKGFATSEKWMLTPYFIGGKRYWVREVGVGTAGDFVESYNFLYFGAGSLIQYNPWDRWVFTGDVAIGRTIDAWINVPPAGLFHTPLGTAPILKLGGEVDYQAARFLHLFAGLDYTYFTFGQSSVQFGSVLEPFSRTQVYNLTLGLRLAFDSVHFPSFEPSMKFE